MFTVTSSLPPQYTQLCMRVASAYSLLSSTSIQTQGQFKALNELKEAIKIIKVSETLQDC